MHIDFVDIIVEFLLDKSVLRVLILDLFTCVLDFIELVEQDSDSAFETVTLIKILKGIMSEVKVFELVLSSVPNEIVLDLIQNVYFSLEMCCIDRCHHLVVRVR